MRVDATKARVSETQPSITNNGHPLDSVNSGLDLIFNDSKLILNILGRDIFFTTPLSWDCECERDYIHPCTEQSCPVCTPNASHTLTRSSGQGRKSDVQLIGEIV